MSDVRQATARDNGFTLVELLTVVAVIAILISLLLPTITAVRKQAQSTQCLSNMRALAQGVMTFAANNDGRVPGGGHHNTGSGSSISWQEILNAEAFHGTNAVPRLNQSLANSKPARFACPVSISSYTPFLVNRRSMGFNGTLLASNNSPMGLEITPPSSRNGQFNRYRSSPVNPDSYYLGAKLAVIRNPSTKFMIVENEAPRDTAGGNDVIELHAVGTLPKYVAGAPGDALLPNPNAPYSFRHPKLTLNAVFCDGHAETVGFAPDAMHTRYWDLKK